MYRDSKTLFRCCLHWWTFVSYCQLCQSLSRIQGLMYFSKVRNVPIAIFHYYGILLFLSFFFYFFYWCSDIVVSIFLPPLSLPTYAHPTWFCPWVPHTWSFMSLSLLFHVISSFYSKNEYGTAVQFNYPTQAY